MALLNTRTLALSLSLLLTSTSLTQAGFVWLSPGAPSAPAADTTYGRQADAPVAPEFGAPEQGRAWAVNPDVPVAGAVAPGVEPVPVVEAAATPELSPAPVPQMTESPAAPVAGSALLRSETVMGTPSYAPGDQTSAPVPTPTLQPPVVSAPVASAPPVLSPITAAPVQPDVTLGQMSSNTESPVAPLPQGTEPVTLTPVETPAAAATPVTPEPSAPVSLVTGQPIASSPAPVAGPAGTDKVVDGFGKQVPLIIALRQILPPAYGFAHRDGVDLTQSVDWQGGRPWQQVLTEALAPVGLKAAITADTVLIEKAEAPAAAAVPAATTQAPASAPAAPVPPPAATPEAQVLTPPASAVSAGGASSARLTNATIMQSPPQGR